ncbi:MAG: Crp/Fnr family transcriptional regulator [Candidatus Abyssobacteria bacterium SURF_17]|jgi:CRP/FNR family transcriptional regulator|uniref:Crp/Fnr family transcriptional regulator n=1 Tax=Candidatus Abyssobacteria bacterium SURF_17 TaxID=2093361 RepID=A0A419EV43_9BACT|nr:MAG: Crp/Fnr family transcriptional regulator [Candidatus Abyssubacteria bacterium SURF_17]
MTTTSAIANELRQVPFFSKLSDAPLREIAKAGREKKFDKGQMIFFENDTCDGFYFIRSGSVKIYKMSSGGREHILHTFKAYETFAEVPTFDNGMCPANAQALENSTLLLIRKSDFEKIMRAYPEVAFGLVHHFARWLRRFTVQLEELSLKDVTARLASYVLKLSEEVGKQTPEGIEIRLNESQQEIASHIGTVREIVSRTFRKFQDMGLIRLKGRRLVVLDRKGLEELV